MTLWRRPSRIVAPVALGLAVVLLGYRWSQRPVDHPAIGAPFPPLALASLSGTPPLTDAGLRAGHVTLVNLFASWCVPCRAEAPQLAALHDAGLVIVGIAVRDTPGDAATFIAATHSKFDHVELDPHSAVQAALGTTGIPETWVVDGHGFVRARFTGDLHADDLPAVHAAVAAAS
ncbi:redoxin family protein [Glacieibacterium megasporae]|uniref:redoxin family protein n=1 Tax=Glacieibacterium megasporae TaxID=2835787 RepID=UPI001C1E44D0|nr:redoxin family protein [Polymorphobacter megasporae]UAJ10422.1 redoxin family protein [Polymorphobacter megasporae]